jgi:imidazolonepropionase-like amidohydrolase
MKPSTASAPPLSDTLFLNARVFDGHAARLSSPQRVFVREGRIAALGDRCPDTAGAVVDAQGRTLMPGLIDCHVHVTAIENSFVATEALPQSLVAFRSGHVLGAMLDRGFTTVRDMGGADHGLVRAVEEGWLRGPRILTCGRVLSQTGGHGDFRGRYDARYQSLCCSGFGRLARLCDGVPDVRRACREELKAGASFIKLMANGGCTSPTDPIEGWQYSREEILAAVEEAQMAKTYVAAHLYTDEAIRRAVELGVVSVEHCNLVERDTARLMREKGAIACPTLITHQAVLDQAGELGLSAESVRKTRMVASGGPSALRVLHEEGVTIVYGSDLLGAMHARQSEEFAILAEHLPAIEVLRSATSHAARLLRMEGRIGCVAPGAFADLVLVDGDPLRDPRLLAHPGNLALVMQGGRVVRERA